MQKNNKPVEKITSNVISNKVRIDLNMLSAATIPDNDIRRCAVKALRFYMQESLPQIILSLNLDGISESALPKHECLRILVEYSLSNPERKHPVYQVDIHLQKDDVVLEDGGLTSAGKFIPSKMGMLIENPFALFAGATSSVISYYTKENGDDISTTLINKQLTRYANIPEIDLIGVRSAVRTHLPSSTVSRDAIYDVMMSKQSHGLALIDQTYTKLAPYNQVSETIKAKLDQMLVKGEIMFKPTGNVPSVSNPKIEIPDKAVTFPAMWSLILASRAVRGGDKGGMGSLTTGYYSYDMPYHYCKAVGRAREILKLASVFAVKAIQVPSDMKEFSMLFVQICIANGLIVISELGTKICKKDSPPGMYARCSVPCLTIKNNLFMEPTMTKTGISMNQGTFPDRMEVIERDLKKKTLCMLTYLTPDLYNFAVARDCMIYPSMSPTSGKVWFVSRKLNGLNISKEHHIRRMIMACYYRNLYPLSRKPFCTADELRNCFSAKVIIPKVVRSEKTGFSFEEFKVVLAPDIELSKISFENYKFVDAIDIKIDYEAEKKKTIGFSLNEAGSKEERYAIIARYINDGELKCLIELSEDDPALREDIEYVKKVGGTVDVTYVEPPLIIENGGEEYQLDGELSDMFDALTIEKK